MYMVETTIRNCASDYGLDPKRFGTHYSPRVGGATTLRAGDASQSTVKHAARWAAALTYQDSEEFDRIISGTRHCTIYASYNKAVYMPQNQPILHPAG